MRKNCDMCPFTDNLLWDTLLWDDLLWDTLLWDTLLWGGRPEADARLVCNGITRLWRGVLPWLQHRGIVVASTSRRQVRLMAVLVNSIF